jgi:ParB family chromosome partitioning protein
LLKGSGWLPEVLRRSDLAALEGNVVAEGQGALSEEVLSDQDNVEEIDLPAFLMADLPVESTAMMAAE